MGANQSTPTQSKPTTTNNTLQTTKYQISSKTLHQPSTPYQRNTKIFTQAIKSTPSTSDRLNDIISCRKDSFNVINDQRNKYYKDQNGTDFKAQQNLLAKQRVKLSQAIKEDLIRYQVSYQSDQKSPKKNRLLGIQKYKDQKVSQLTQKQMAKQTISEKCQLSSFRIPEYRGYLDLPRKDKPKVTIINPQTNSQIQD